MTPDEVLAEPLFQAPDEGITVRMYDTGFGDCLLLALKDDEGKPRYILIDCGIHHSYPDAKEKMKAVVEDIGLATKKELHVVAITHEHTDHLYGFKHAREQFNKITMHDLWLPWTEDPTNEVANEFKEKYGMRVNALKSIAAHLESKGSPLSRRFTILPDYDPPAQLGMYGGKADQLTYLRTESKNAPKTSEDYLDPEKDPITLCGVSGVKFYVLGPPKKLKWIRSEKRESEIYPELSSFDEESFLQIALSQVDKEDTPSKENPMYKRTRPFNEEYQVTKKIAARTKFFQEKYGFKDIKEHGPSWRRIEDDWLRSAELLALDLDNKTNNTSLVLAVELTDTGKVLLFAADAQVGNWLSWHDYTWTGNQPDEVIKAEDLLKRTVLYKVGHHGSRNATLKKKGLMMMTSKELVAMIPVDKTWAQTKQGWEHPANNLLTEIRNATKGRVIRMDEIPEDAEKPPMPSEEEDEDQWKEFTDNLEWDTKNQLWIQYTIK
jgi:beta-lactamase superfamily II metal-dependent hydrolase